MRIAHMSDLHLCAEAGGKHQREKVLEWADEARRLGARHLVLTGDVVDYANLADASRFFDGLSEIGFRGPRDVTVVPGNHDVFPLGHFRKKPFSGDADKNLDSFKRRARRWLSRDERVFSNECWPFIRRLGRDVVLVAMDTVYRGGLGRLRGGVGQLDEQDAQAVLEALEAHHSSCRWRVLVMHHWPFAWKTKYPELFIDVNFEELARVQRFIADGGFDLVLCGHRHAFDIKRIGKAKVFGSGNHFWETDDDQIGFEAGFHLIELGRRLTISEHGEIDLL